MKSGSSFLLAARQCEIAELEQLARTCELVGVIGRLVHALQRERGLASVFLSSQGAIYAAQREQQAAACRVVEQEVRVHFEQLDTDASRVRNGSRLFSRVAVALHGLEGLPVLRERIAAQACEAPEATAAYIKLVAALLAVVFEAADAATDPEVSRALVAMFNFMQGKEFAGQERAFGARAFAAGAIAPEGVQQWRHLIDAQQGCFQAFADFSDPEVLRADQASRDPAVLAELERLRRIGCTSRGPLEQEASHAWYACCTRRIDAMKEVEDLLALNLRRLCETRIAQTRAELRDQRALLEEIASRPVGTAPYGPQLERSILDMVQEQSRRLQAMSDELDAVRSTLNERKVVERAKGLLMAHRAMSEDEAYKALRQMAMNQNRRLVDVAGAVLSLADVLPGGR
ncbi:nitrate- and nitrite sensing domain-containing protein [Ramlibacter sp. XY19]|uniref:nitrate regulatory protein n=1 Tax=Ramlibacter paludis TaxID=2908000 RepID=UPI0023DAAD7B|nr:nitrate regulatory protein [Ramlibacter paludis]MCG2594014.1 nitrate- and nitrite sensing domain-containing protein [Ramlibacter paludis]